MEKERKEEEAIEAKKREEEAIERKKREEEEAIDAWGFGRD
jgi:hypothetical protein